MDGKPHPLLLLQSWHAKDVPPGLGTCVWEASIALVRSLELCRQWVEGKSVLELGCGPGLVAIACAALGAKVSRVALKPFSCGWLSLLGFLCSKEKRVR